MKLSRLAAYATVGIIGGLLTENLFWKCKERMAEKKIRHLKEKEERAEMKKAEKDKKKKLKNSLK